MRRVYDEVTSANTCTLGCFSSGDLHDQPLTLRGGDDDDDDDAAGSELSNPLRWPGYRWLHAGMVGISGDHRRADGGGGSAERRSSKSGTEKLRAREEVRGAPGPGEEARGAPVHSWLHPACLASLFRLGSNIVRRLALISLPSPRRLGLPHWVDDVS